MASVNPLTDNTLADIRESMMGDHVSEAEQLLAGIHHDDMTETLFKDISAAVGRALASPDFDPDRYIGVWTDERVEKERAKSRADMDRSFEVFRNAFQLKEYENEDFWTAIVDVRKAYTRFHDAPREVRSRANEEMVEHMVESGILPTLSEILWEQLSAGFDMFKVNGDFERELCRVCYKTLAFFFYFSDTSRRFAQAVTEGPCSLLKSVKAMLDRFMVPFFIKELKKELQEMLFVGLALSYNLVMHDDSQTILRIREMDLMGSVRPYLYSNEERFKVLPLLFMLYVANESEYCSNPSVIKYLVDQLMIAAESKDKSAGGYKVWELMRAIEKLAALDVNKHLLFEIGTVDRMKKLLLSCNQEEMTGALHILTHLAFDKEVAESIRAEVYEFTQDQLLHHENEELQKAASSMMWVVEEKLDRRDDGASMGFRSLRRQASRPPRPEEKESEAEEEVDLDDTMVLVTMPEQRHVMISYNWESQARVVKVKEYLEAQNFTVWFDTEQMGRNLLDSMAEGVEGAWVVLVCYSRKYKLSRNCRSEAEYASKLLKPIIPLQMEPYEPDGWLGLLVGRLFVHDYSHEITDDANFQLFTSLTRLKESLAKGDQTSLTFNPSAPDVSPVHPITRFSCGEITSRDLNFLSSWGEAELQAWFEANNMDRKAFDFVSGKELKLLTRMRKESPNAFYRYLTKKLPLSEMASFVEALDLL